MCPDRHYSTSHLPVERWEEQSAEQVFQAFPVLEVMLEGPGDLTMSDRAIGQFDNGEGVIVVQTFERVYGVVVELESAQMFMHVDPGKEIREFKIGIITVSRWRIACVGILDPDDILISVGDSQGLQGVSERDFGF